MTGIDSPLDTALFSLLGLKKLSKPGFFMRLINRISSWLTSSKVKQEINYLYFTFLLFSISLLSLSYFLKEDHPLAGIHIFFIICSLGQSLLEVCFFMLIASLLKRWAPNWLFNCFIGLLFIAILAYYVDFTLLRLMDTSLSYIFKFFFGSGFNHLATAFLALNMNPTMIGMIFASFIFIPFLGIGFYGITHLGARKNPWSLSLFQMSCTLFAISLSLFSLDLFAYPYLNRLAYKKYQKALPLGATFFSPPPVLYKLTSPIAPCRKEQMITDRIQEIEPAKTVLPNIYFFIIETLRRDFTGPEIAPHLADFSAENISFPHTFSNANYTNLSWFALLHAEFPYHWTSVRDTWQEGSAPLRILKKLGYKIKIYSSADLSYFNMDQVLFGHQRQLIDQVEEYTDERNLQPCDRDALAIKAFTRDIDQASQGTVFLFFLDSPHSEYSFPADFPLKFKPISKEISYLTLNPASPELERLKNRYRNSIAYVDSLMGDFFSILKKKHLYEEALIIITGDHGEEFFEEGALFHGTHLNKYQLNVPIFCKFPKTDWEHQIDPTRDMMSHIDLFPSIIHYTTRSSLFSDLFDGQSIFEKQSWPYHIAVLQNGANPPVEFTIERKEKKLTARFLDAHHVEILEPSPTENISIQSLIETDFPGVFKKLQIYVRNS